MAFCVFIFTKYIVPLRSSRVYDAMWYEVEQKPTLKAYFVEFCGAW